MGDPPCFSHRTLPHWYPPGRPIFLTWRLFGSPPPAPPASSPGHRFALSDRIWDRADSGPVWLRDESIAAATAEVIRSGAPDLYALHAWVIMPNHVHALFTPVRPLPVIMQKIKGASARRANLLLGRRHHAFWQRESFDHWVRDEYEFERIRFYIEQNPVKAGLAPCASAHRWSSAFQVPVEYASACRR